MPGPSAGRRPGPPEPSAGEHQRHGPVRSRYEHEEIRRRIVEKYGFMTKITKVLGTVIGAARGKRVPYGDTGVVVTLSSPAAGESAPAV